MSKNGNIATETGAVMEVRRGSTTVKIYRVKNRSRDLFMVTWFIAGRRYRKNFTVEKVARAEAANIAEKLSRGQAQSLLLTGADRESYVHARGQLAHSRVPLHEAVAEYAAAAERLKGQRLSVAVDFYLRHAETQLPAKRVAAVYEAFLEQQRIDGRSDRYLQDIRSRLGRFAAAFQMDITEVQTQEVNEWLQSLGISNRTRLNFRTVLVTFFRYARQVGYLPKDRSTAAEDLSKPRTDGGEIEIYSPGELQRLIDHSDQRTLPILCFGAFAGLRTAEIERLDWENVRWDSEVIEIGARSSKTRRRRLIPILPPLRKGLYQFSARSGAVVDRIKLQYRLKNLGDTAGVKRKANALRHSFASYRVAQIQDVAQVALEMGIARA